MAKARPNEIPNYIQAVTPRGLRLAMIENNTRQKLTIQYFDIQYVKGKWFAWFYLPIKHDDEVFNDKTI